MLICIVIMTVMVQCSKSPAEGRWTTFSAEDGLANNWITAITVDSRGNKWFGCMIRSISCYNNRSWTTYSVPEEFVCGYIFDIAVDKDNNKWIGTLGSGAIRFDGVNWTSYNESSPRARASRSTSPPSTARCKA